jgi:hypothetical protein
MIAALTPMGVDKVYSTPLPLKRNATKSVAKAIGPLRACCNARGAGVSPPNLKKGAEMNVKSLTASLMAAAGLLAASPASANLVLYGDYTSPPPGDQITYTADDDRGQLNCSSCEGLLSNLVTGVYDANVPSAGTASGFSATSVDLFFLGNASDAQELAFVNAVTGQSFSSGTKLDGGGGDKVFSTDAEYILLKIGAKPDFALIHNTGGLQTFSYVAFQGEGAGLSHYALFGGTTTVPEPSILAILGLGVLLLGFLRRRTSA